MSVLGATIVLAQRGYAVHWVRPRSKAPIADGWSTAPVATITTLRQTYRLGYNVGVRCGHWSQPRLGHGLVVLDVDINSQEATGPALAAVETLLGDTPAGPMVLSGSGNGSRHLWFACPVDALPPKANITILHAQDWKLEVLSTGKQVVVPPSMHPSGQPYRWLTPLTTIPLLPASVHTAVDAVLAATMQTAIATGRVVHGRPAGTGTRPGDDFNRRTVPIPEACLAALKQHRARQAEEKLLLGPAYQDHGLVFCRPDGTPMDPELLPRTFARLLREADLPPLRFHDARHTFATLMLELGESPKTVQTMLGHSRVAITLDLYSHVSLELEKKAAAKLNAALTARG